MDLQTDAVGHQLPRSGYHFLQSFLRQFLIERQSKHGKRRIAGNGDHFRGRGALRRRTMEFFDEKGEEFDGDPAVSRDQDRGFFFTYSIALWDKTRSL